MNTASPLERRHWRKATGASGFTLIELSIVLVIIGLIVGGVFVGRDLIVAAELKATLSQLEKYTAAVNTFRGKFDCIPGDCTPTQAAQIGLYPRGGGLGDGNRDEYVDSLWFQQSGWGNLLGADIALGGENVLFWTDLSAANLIDGSFTDQSDAILLSIPAGGISTELPNAKIGRNASVFVYGHGFSAQFLGGLEINNYYQIFVVSSIDGGTGAITTGDVFTPGEALSIDQKIDDGLPLTGKVQAMMSKGFPTWTDGVYIAVYGPSATFTNCVQGVNNVYNTTLTTISCNLRFDAGF